MLHNFWRLNTAHFFFQPINTFFSKHFEQSAGWNVSMNSLCPMSAWGPSAFHLWMPCSQHLSFLGAGHLPSFSTLSCPPPAAAGTPVSSRLLLWEICPPLFLSSKPPPSPPQITSFKTITSNFYAGWKHQDREATHSRFWADDYLFNVPFLVWLMTGFYDHF